jgi:hypothetical protein
MPDEPVNPNAPPPDVPPTPGDGAPQASLSADATDTLVRAIGMVFSQALTYGPEHGVTKKTIASTFDTINKGLAQCGELQFSITDDALLVNNVSVNLKNPLAKGFASHLIQRDIRNFSLEKSLTLEKFGSLIEVLNKKADVIKSEGGFAHVIGKTGIEGVRSAKISFVQVTEDDVVISKDALMETVGSEISADQILNLLRKGGTATEADRAALRSIQNSEKSTEILGEAIVTAAQQHEKSGAGGGGGPNENGKGGDGSGSTLVDSAIEYMQQTYEVLAGDPSTKTQKGKKNLLRIVEELEGEITRRLRAADSEFQEADAAKIAEAVEGMADELKIDALASEYMKKRGAIDASEKRVLRFIKAKGLDKLGESELREKLQDAGLTLDNWRDLLAKSGLMEGGKIETVDFTGLNVVEHLASLLQTVSAEFLLPPPLPNELLPPQVIQATLGELKREASDFESKGQKDLARILGNLGLEIEKRLGASHDGITLTDATQLAEAVDVITNDLKIDAIASEYMKKRGAVDGSEKQILRFFKAKGLDHLTESELGEKMQEAGLSLKDWRDLLTRNGMLNVGQMETVDFSGLNVTEHLAGLLQNMSNVLAQPEQEPGSPLPPPIPGSQVREVLTEIHREVGTMMTSAETRIGQVMADFQEDVRAARAAGGEGRVQYKLSRRRLMTVLAEVGQEICQPLAVVNCAIEMILNRSLGDITEPQIEMLTLATDGGARLKQLADKLMEIAGLPETMNPDADIQDDLFDR